MGRQRNYIVRSEKVSVGLEDSKKTWQVCVRSEGMIVHEASMPARYEVLRNYFNNRFPECQIEVMYEAGFSGFELHDQLEADIKRVRNRILRMLESHDLDDGLPAGRWGQAMYGRVRLPLAGTEMSDSLRLSSEVMFRELEQLCQLRKDLLLQLRRLARSDRYKEGVELLKSAPGIGMLNAIRLVLEWGDVSRFGRKEEFASFLGRVPSDYSRGNRNVRDILPSRGIAGQGHC